MPITRSEAKKISNYDIDTPIQNGHIASASAIENQYKQSAGTKRSGAATVNNRLKYNPVTKPTLPSTTVTVSKMSDKKKQPTPSKTPSKGKTWTLNSLADLIQKQGSNTEEQLKGVKEEIQKLVEWQTSRPTDEKLKKLEEAKGKTATDLTSFKVDIDKILAENIVEMRTLRKKYQTITKQVITTQGVLRQVHNENNLNSRNNRGHNIRIGNMAEPAAPDPTGDRPGIKPREDTRKLVADMIIKYKLHPCKSVDQAIGLIDFAYRTGKAEKRPKTGQGKKKQSQVRNVLVKFSTIKDRNIIMRAGKKMERENTLGGAFFMDDHSPEDYSQKRRCHALMKELKNKDKRPFFVGGKLRTTDGFVNQKAINDYNNKNGVEDHRIKEINVDMLTMHLEADPSTPKKSTHPQQRGQWEERKKK